MKWKGIGVLAVGFCVINYMVPSINMPGFWAVSSKIDHKKIVSNKQDVNESIKDLGIGSGVMENKVMLADEKVQVLISSTMLSGTQIPDQLSVTADNHLMVNDNVRGMVDYFLTALGDVTLIEFNEGMIAYLQSTLPHPASDEAIEIFQDYIAYIEAYDALNTDQLYEPNSEPLLYPYQLDEKGFDILVGRLGVVKQLREEFMGQEVADTLWQQENDYDQALIDRVRYTDPKLLDAADDVVAQDYHRSMQHLKTFHAGDTVTVEKAYEHNAQLFGAEAALRLEALDDRRALWDQRYSNYVQDRDQLLMSEGISDNDKQQSLSQLRLVHFPKRNEQKRVSARDRYQK